MEIRSWFLIGIIFSSSQSGKSSGRGYFFKCKTGVTMEIYPDGTINGTQGKAGKFAIRLVPVQRTDKQVAFLGLEAKSYMCMNDRGRFYGSVTMETHCIFSFLERPSNYISFFRKIGKNRRRHFVGFTRTGLAKWGSRKHRRTKFLLKTNRRKRAFGIEKISVILNVLNIAEYDH